MKKDKTILLAITLTFTSHLQAQSIYYSDIGAGYIQRANIDGTGVTNLVNIGFAPNSHLTVSDSHIYWSEQNNNRIRRANLDGSGINTIVSDGWGDIEIYDGQMYFLKGTTTGGATFPTWEIWRAALDGTGQTQLTSGAALRSTDLEIRGKYMYATTGQDIVRYTLNGSNGTVIATHPGTSSLQYIEVSANHIYWSEANDQIIHRTDLTGANYTALNPAIPDDTGEYGIGDIEVVGSHLYFEAQDGKSLWKSNLDASNASAVLPNGTYRYAFEVTPIPEPSSIALLGLGALSLFIRRNR